MSKYIIFIMSLLLMTTSISLLPLMGVKAQTVPTCNGLQAHYVGTSGADYIVASRKPGMPSNQIVVVVAGAGNDTIYGVDFTSAYICGNEGQDKIYGANSRYRIYGGQGDDIIYGGRNSDYIEGNLGNDYINGRGGGDTIYGNEDNDRLYGSCDGSIDAGCVGYTDRIYGGQGNDELYGGAGNDFLYGNLGYDKAHGGSGNTSIPDNDACYSSETVWACERNYP